MQILKEAGGIDCHKERLIGKYFMDQNMKVQMDQGEKKYEDWKKSRTFCSTYTARILPMKLFKGLETVEQ